MTGEAVLKTRRGGAIPLKGVTARGRLEGLLFELTVEQVYENSGPRNIEAEFTFPVPCRAVLLGLELQIGERALQAVAVRKQAAREQYEEAIDQGDSAALLEPAGGGLWHLSLGNLLAGERALIRYRYAELLDSQGTGQGTGHDDEVRLTVPTVIAPRYGDAARAGLPVLQVPATALLAEYPFALTVDIVGAMAGATTASPTHALASTAIEGGLRLTLATGPGKPAFLDRDFVLRLSGPVTRSAALLATDPGREGGPGCTALLSLDPAPVAGAPAERSLAPLALKILVDCSGSMAGTSLDCAKRALLAVLDQLRPADRVSLTRFGSSVDHATPGLVAVGGGSGLLARIQRHVSGQKPALDHAVRHLQADLGGTELAAALRAVLAIPVGEATTRDILLVTDAEVWELDGVLAAVASAGHRLFVVAVGAAPVESLSRRLAAETGGACEFVAPGEEAEAAILRTVNRLRETPKRIVEVEWPAAPEWALPLPATLFAGDTLHLIAGFATPPVGEVKVTVEGAEGVRTLTARFDAVTDNLVLPRLAAARRLPLLADEEAVALAECYQLASAHTSLVVVKARAEGEKAVGLPELAPVPHMLAAGWGGTSRSYELPTLAMPPRPAVLDSLSRDDVPCFYLPESRRSAEPPAQVAIDHGDRELFDLGAGGSEDDAGAPPAVVIAAIVAALRANPGTPLLVDDLAGFGVPAAVLDELRAAIHAQGLDEAAAVRCWIALLAGSAAARGLWPSDRRLLDVGVAGDRSLRAARVAVRGLLRGVSEAEWTVEVPEVQVVR